MWIRDTIERGERIFDTADSEDIGSRKLLERSVYAQRNWGRKVDGLAAFSGNDSRFRMIWDGGMHHEDVEGKKGLRQ